MQKPSGTGLPRCACGVQTLAPNRRQRHRSVFCQVLVGHVAGFFPASWLLHEGVGYSPGFALVA